MSECYTPIEQEPENYPGKILELQKEIVEMAKKIQWQEEMISRAKVLICVGQDDERWPKGEKSWLEDLQKGPETK